MGNGELRFRTINYLHTEEYGMLFDRGSKAVGEIDTTKFSIKNHSYNF